MATIRDSVLLASTRELRRSLPWRFFTTCMGATTVWWIGIAVGVFSSLIHLPVREEPRLKFQPN